jgi:hypothetical protein
MVDILIPDAIQSRSELSTKTQDGRDLYIGAGWVLFGLKGSPGGAWNYRDLRFDVGPQWRNTPTPEIVPTVALASIMNSEVANDAGWAIDDCAVEFTQPQDLLSRRCQLVCRIGVRDVDGIMYRVSYHVAMLGQLR